MSRIRELYNLYVIISVGCRVGSRHGIEEDCALLPMPVGAGLVGGFLEVALDDA